jgi:Predicted membrane protein
MVKDGEMLPLPPRDDINAPDLYIPSMSFVTWVMLVSLFSSYMKMFEDII